MAFVQEDETVLQICEVYYNDENKPNGYINKNTITSIEGIKGLKWIMSKYREALKKPILYGGDKFPQEYTER